MLTVIDLCCLLFVCYKKYIPSSIIEIKTRRSNLYFVGCGGCGAVVQSSRQKLLILRRKPTWWYFSLALRYSMLVSCTGRWWWQMPASVIILTLQINAVWEEKMRRSRRDRWKAAAAESFPFTVEWKHGYCVSFSETVLFLGSFSSAKRTSVHY